MHNMLARCIFLIACIAFAKSQTKVGDTCVDQYTSTVGRCKAADTCESARIDYQKNGISPTFCTYSAFGTTLVCCRDGGNILHTADTKPTPPTWGIDNNRQSADKKRVSERNDKDVTTEQPLDEVIKPFVHYYPKDDSVVDHPAFPTHSQGDIEDRDFYAKDQEYPGRTSSTEEELIAKVWAFKLKRLLTEQRRYAEKIINDILFEADMGTLTKEHVVMVQKQMNSDTVVAAQQEVKTQNRKEAKNASDEILNATVDMNGPNPDEKTAENLPILQLQLTINNPEDNKNNSK